MNDMLCKDLNDPPRKLSLWMKIQNILWGTITVNGVMGWLFLSSGLGVALLMAIELDITGYFAFNGELDKSKGEIIHFVNSGRSHDDMPVLAISYQFTYKDKKVYKGVSYASGLYKKGEKVNIEYPKGQPGHSRIVGMDTSRFTFNSLYLLFLPALGLYLCVPPIRRGFRANKLLENGVTIMATLTEAKRTKTVEKKKRVYHLTYSYNSSDDKVFRLSKDARPDPKDLTDDNQELVFYQPQNPKEALFAHDIPGRFTVGGDGVIEPEKLERTIYSLIPPGLGLILFILVVLS